MEKQGNYIKYIKYNGDKFIRKDTMTKEQQIEHLYNIVRNLSETIEAAEEKIIDNEISISTLNGFSEGQLKYLNLLVDRVNKLEQNQPKSDKSVSQTKGSETDWENLLDIDDVKTVFGYYPLNSEEIDHFNQIIHERIKPLLDKNSEELVLREEYDKLYYKLHNANERLSTIKALSDDKPYN